MFVKKCTGRNECIGLCLYLCTHETIAHSESKWHAENLATHTFETEKLQARAHLLRDSESLNMNQKQDQNKLILVT